MFVSVIFFCVCIWWFNNFALFTCHWIVSTIVLYAIEIGFYHVTVIFNNVMNKLDKQCRWMVGLFYSVFNWRNGLTFTRWLLLNLISLNDDNAALRHYTVLHHPVVSCRKCSCMSNTHDYIPLIMTRHSHTPVCIRREVSVDYFYQESSSLKELLGLKNGWEKHFMKLFQRLW